MDALEEKHGHLFIQTTPSEIYFLHINSNTHVHSTHITWSLSHTYMRSHAGVKLRQDAK